MIHGILHVILTMVKTKSIIGVLPLLRFADLVGVASPSGIFCKFDGVVVDILLDQTCLSKVQMLTSS